MLREVRFKVRSISGQTPILVIDQIGSGEGAFHAPEDAGLPSCFGSCKLSSARASIPNVLDNGIHFSCNLIFRSTRCHDNVAFEYRAVKPSSVLARSFACDPQARDQSLVKNAPLSISQHDGQQIQFGVSCAECRTSQPSETDLGCVNARQNCASPLSFRRRLKGHRCSWLIATRGQALEVLSYEVLYLARLKVTVDEN